MINGILQDGSLQNTPPDEEPIEVTHPFGYSMHIVDQDHNS